MPTLVGVLALGASRNLTLSLLTASPGILLLTLQAGVTRDIALADRFTLTFMSSVFPLFPLSIALHRNRVCCVTVTFVQIPLWTVRPRKFVGVSIGIPLEVSRLRSERSVLVVRVWLTTFLMLLKRLIRERSHSMVPTLSGLKWPLTSLPVVPTPLSYTSMLNMT